MALWIQNITKGERPDSEPHDYAVRINRQPPLAYFTHVRNEGAAACLRRAANAIDEAAEDSPFVLPYSTFSTIIK